MSDLYFDWGRPLYFDIPIISKGGPHYALIYVLTACMPTAADLARHGSHSCHGTFALESATYLLTA